LSVAWVGLHLRSRAGRPLRRLRPRPYKSLVGAGAVGAAGADFSHTPYQAVNRNV